MTIDIIKRIRDLLNPTDGDLLIDGPHEVIRRQREREGIIDSRTEEEIERAKRFKGLSDYLNER